VEEDAEPLVARPRADLEPGLQGLVVLLEGDGLTRLDRVAVVLLERGAQRGRELVPRHPAEQLVAPAAEQALGVHAEEGAHASTRPRAATHRTSPPGWTTRNSVA
jgi:hypothetical protein